MLGEVATDLEASKLLYRKAAEALRTPEGPLMAAHAKRFVPDATVKAANTCIQVFGWYGPVAALRTGPAICHCRADR